MDPATACPIGEGGYFRQRESSGLATESSSQMAILNRTHCTDPRNRLERYSRDILRMLSCRE